MIDEQERQFEFAKTIVGGIAVLTFFGPVAQAIWFVFAAVVLWKNRFEGINVRALY